MSVECLAYVVEHSPYTGNAYVVHMMMAEIANATYEYRLFTTDKVLAVRCRVSHDTLARCRSQMVADGYLEVLNGRASKGHPLEYRFLMPAKGTQVAYLSDPAKGTQTAAKGTQIEPQRYANDAPSSLITEGTEEEPKSPPLFPPPAGQMIGTAVAVPAENPNRNAIWDAVMDACRIDTTAIPVSVRSGYGKVVKELVGVGAEPDEVARRALCFRMTYPGLTLTPSALLKHWPQMAGGPTRPRTTRYGRSITETIAAAAAQDQQARHQPALEA